MTTITFLGTGTSNGIPVIGCGCAVCRSPNPRDNRGRTSALVRTGAATILIDTATELRIQALREGIDHVDAVLFTHAHADHTGGFDDLRRFNEIQQSRLPIYTGPETAAMLMERFAYAFSDPFPFFGGKPDLILNTVEGPFEAVGLEIVPIPVWHGSLRVFGYRIGNIAYVTDAGSVPEESIEALRGVDVLVLNALRERPHATHLSVSQAVAVIEHVAPKHAFLVHLSHELSHDRASELVPDNVTIAYDGLTVNVDEIGAAHARRDELAKGADS